MASNREKLSSCLIILLNTCINFTLCDIICNFSESKTYRLIKCEITSLFEKNLKFDFPTIPISKFHLKCKNEEVIDTFPSHIFARLVNIEELVINDCGFKNIDSNAFRELGKLRRIIIANKNNISGIRIADNVFESNPNLGYITINMTTKEIANQTFCNFKFFVRLNLIRTNIQNLQEIGCGKNDCSCKHLNVLNLANNKLTNITATDLVFLPLAELNLSHNEIQTASFAHSKQLETIDLSFNRLTFIPTDIFPFRLRRLNLSNNHLFFNKTNEDVLAKLVFLKVLDLSHNRMNLSTEIFKNLTSLQYLYLSNNLELRIKFNYSQHLDVLDLSNNSITNLNLWAAGNSKRAKTINLAHNKIIFDETTLVGLNMVSEINLSHNGLKYIPNVKVLQHLEYLDLSFNNISDVSANVFDNMTRLLELSLEGNEINALQSYDFVHLTNLKLLNLKSNKIKHIAPETFNHIGSPIQILLQNNIIQNFNFSCVGRKIHSIDLNGNEIQILTFPDILRDYELEYIDVSSNRLTMFPGLQQLSHIKGIVLANNSISSIGEFNNIFTPTLEVVDLRENSILEIPYNHVQFYFRRHQLRLIDVRKNPIICSCENQWLWLNEFSDLDFQRSVIKTDAHCIVQYPRIKNFTSHLKTSTAKSENMLCEDVERCPHQCVCFYNMYAGIYILDCFNASWNNTLPALPTNSTTVFFDANHNIESVVDTLLMNSSMVHTLYMNKSELRSIFKEMFCAVVNLRELHLQENFITEIIGNEFNCTIKLQKLFLHQNHLQFLSPEAFWNLKLTTLTLHNNKLLQPQLWLILQHASEISLGENLFKCDCDFVIPFQQWVSKSHEIKFNDLNNALCTDSKIPIMQFDQLNCSEDINLTLIIVPIVSILIFAIILMSFVYSYKLEMQVWLYSRYGLLLFHYTSYKEADEGKVYHAFISYDSEDDEWIAHTLVPRLTEYKLCIHQRDFPVGGSISDSIVQAVRNSCRTVVVLTPRFLQSHWCQFEFKIAHMQSLLDKCRRLVVVILEDVDENEMSPLMRTYMKTNTYLKTNDAIFWSKLKHALPDLDNQ